MHSHNLKGWVGGSKSRSSLRKTSVPNYDLVVDITRPKLSTVLRMCKLGHTPADYTSCNYCMWVPLPVNTVVLSC